MPGFKIVFAEAEVDPVLSGNAAADIADGTDAVAGDIHLLAGEEVIPGFGDGDDAFGEGNP